MFLNDEIMNLWIHHWQFDELNIEEFERATATVWTLDSEMYGTGVIQWYIMDQPFHWRFSL